MPKRDPLTPDDRATVMDYLASWEALLKKRGLYAGIVRSTTKPRPQGSDDDPKVKEWKDATLPANDPTLRFARAEIERIDRHVLAMARKAPLNPPRSTTPRSRALVAKAVTAVKACMPGQPSWKQPLAPSQVRNPTMLAWAVYGMHTYDSPGSDEWDALVAEAIAKAPHKTPKEGALDVVAMLIEARRIDGTLKLGSLSARANVKKMADTTSKKRTTSRSRIPAKSRSKHAR